MTQTYTLAPPPEPPMTWEAYEALIMREYEALLAVDADEPSTQDFFERHPCMLPGAHGPLNYPSGHGPFPGGVITQPVLPSFRYRVPDFMWLARNSDTETPVLIEIERPN